MGTFLGLIKRLVKGSPLTAAEGDDNLSRIEQAISDLQQAGSTFPSADGATLEIVANTLRVKDAGIVAAKMATDSVLQAAMADDAIGPAEVKSASVNITSSSNSTALDWSLGFSFYTTLSENTTIAFSNTKEGQAITVAVKQNAGAAKSLAWGSTIQWPGGVAPTMTPTLSATDVYTITKINSIFYGSAGQAYA